MNTAPSTSGTHPMNPDTGNAEIMVQPPTRPQRGSRIKLACSRCQKRKIKCDGRLPCSGCKKAGSVCFSGSSVKDRPVSKAYVNSLWNRIRWLESTITEVSPSTDLSEAPEPPELPEADGDRDGHPSHPNIESSTPVPDGQQPERVHDIGLVSLGVGQDLRYVGPSSGYVFSRLLLKIAGIPRRTDTAPAVSEDVLTAAQSLRVTAAPLPARIEDAELLCAVYWETIHPQYPFLHRPTHRKRLEHIYTTAEAAKPLYRFQVCMVLAISATLLSHRLKTTALSAEGFAAAALEAWEQLPAGSPAGSLEGLQSLLLLIVYALFSPSSRLNAWYLNYQAIAAVLDLGLQRDVKPRHTHLTRLTREMRTRIFWVVYTLDRTLATVFGRPVGLRDEACDLRLPADLDDDALLDPDAVPRRTDDTPTAMTTAIHLFRLARLNSEIKYIGHSISNKTPSYCYPAVPDVLVWRADMAQRLDIWAADLPEHCCSPGLAQLMRLRYHEAKILLLRPSPAVPRATAADLRVCHASAAASLDINIDLYRSTTLIYSWISVHALFLEAITLLYCLASLPDLAGEDLDALQSRLQSVSNILSAAAETWPDAKRSRDVLQDISAWTLRLLRRSSSSHDNQATDLLSETPSSHVLHQNSEQPWRPFPLPLPQQIPSLPMQQQQPLDLRPGRSFDTLFYTLFPTGDSPPSLDEDLVLQGIFRDYQPIVDFDTGFDMDLGTEE